MKTSNPYPGVKLEFHDENDKHLFLMNGQKVELSVTGATSILDKSGALMTWAVNLSRDYLLDKFYNHQLIDDEEIVYASTLHRAKKKEAGEKGTAAHKWIEDYIAGRNPETPKDENVANSTLAFLQWVSENKVKFINSEELLYSLKHRYAGILDAEAKINGKLALVDFKTGKGIYNEARYQTAGYRIAKTEMTGKDYKERWIIRLDKETANFQILRLTEHKKDEKAFLAALALRRRENEIKAEK